MQRKLLFWSYLTTINYPVIYILISRYYLLYNFADTPYFYSGNSQVLSGSILPISTEYIDRGSYIYLYCIVSWTFENKIKWIRISENRRKEELSNWPIPVDSTAYTIGKKCHLFNKFVMKYPIRMFAEIAHTICDICTACYLLLTST